MFRLQNVLVPFSRRSVTKIRASRSIGAALCAALGLSVNAASATGVPVDPAGKDRIAPVVPLVALPFEPKDVRLTDGPFRRAMELDALFLLSVEPDRLLSWFRREAGLPPRANNYGGWEARGVAGHSLGHYL